MAWGLLGDWNSTLLPHIWDSLVDRVWEETEILTRIVFDKIILPAGQALLNTTEAAVQYTLNGEYEVVQEVTRTSLNQTLSWLDLTNFQVKLLREFSVIFLGNSLLVLLAWKVYGERIRNKFMTGRKGSARESIEELRTSMSELKLPSEMDFKYK